MFCPLIAAVKTGISPAVRSGGQPLTPQPNKRGLIAATVAGLGLGLAALLTLCKTSAAPGLTPPPPANYIHLARAAEEETPPPIRPTTPTAELQRGHPQQWLPNHQPQSAHPPCLPVRRLGLSERSSFTSQRVRGL